MIDEPLQRFVERLVDGKALDWAEVSRELPPASERALRRIESIARAYRGVAPAPARPGFQHIQLLERIGGGFGGEVWRARDTVLDRTVALKLRNATHIDGRQQARLLDEARALARIDHPHVLRVLGADVAGGRVGVWSEFVEGEDLESRMQREGRSGPEEARAIGIALCGALAAVHRAGFVHGDIKPANVLRTHEGRYVLCDLGSAVALRERVGAQTLASGSPLYLAPEVLAGEAPGIASDVYALGATLFHLLAGRAPVTGDNFDALLAAHRAGRRVHLRDLRPDLPDALVAAVEKAVDPRPDARHAGAGAFELALAESSRGHGALLATAACVVLVLAAAGIAWLASRPAPALVNALAWHRGDRAAPLLDNAPVRQGDTFFLELDCARPCWAYVLSEDGTREAVPLFPLPATRANPLSGRQRLPGNVGGNERHWRIGPARGNEERLLLVVAPRPVAALEPSPAASGEGERFRGIDAIVPAPAVDPAAGLEAVSARLAAEPDAQLHWLRLQRGDASAPPAGVDG